MSSPRHHQPTRVLPSTAEQPAATTEAPPAARFWRQKLPARIGRARTSTVVLSVVFLASSALYLGVRPDYVTVTTVDGATVRVDRSQLSTPAAPPEEPPAPTPTDLPVPGVPTDTTVPGTPTEEEESTPETTEPTGTGQDDEETTAPAPTTSRAPGTTRAPATTRTPSTTRFPATTQDPDADQDPQADDEPEATPTPTG
jgi:hypothetical protein